MSAGDPIDPVRIGSGRARRAAVLACTIVAFGSSTARAEDATAAAAVADLFRAGADLARERRYDEAIETWRRAYIDLLPGYRDRPFLHPVGARLMDRKSLEAFMVDSFDRDLPDAKAASLSLAYEKLGFFPPRYDLKRNILELMTAAIAGFYDPDTKSLYLIKTEGDGAERGLFERLFAPAFNVEEKRSTLSHELTHALADQHWDLFSMYHSVVEDDDMALAYSALVEGEACVVMLMDIVAMRGQNPRSVLAGPSRLLERLFAAMLEAGVGMASGAVAVDTPPIVLEQLVFPYAQGFRFAGRLVAGDAWERVDAAYRSPPVSTEQVLHPEKYLGDERDEPQRLAFPAAAPFSERWQTAYENVVGELSIASLLRPRLGDDLAAAAAAGWDGDVFRVAMPPARDGETVPSADRACLVWTTTWDSEDDRREFARALEQLVGFRQEAEAERAVALRDDLPAATALWREERRASGIWERGLDVVLVDGAPARRAAEIAAWGLAVERSPKRFELEKHRSALAFPSPEGRRRAWFAIGGIRAAAAPAALRALSGRDREEP